MKTLGYLFSILLLLATPAFAGVTVSSPANDETVNPSAHYVATATTNTCSKGVASMGVYVDDQLTYVVNGTTLNTNISLQPGSHHTVVEEWDYCGGATYTPLDVVAAGQTGVWVASPAPNSDVSWITGYVATATTDCPKGVGAMGIYVNNQLVYVVQGAKLNKQMNLSPGPQHTVVEEWDRCGGAKFTTIDVNVHGGNNILGNLQLPKGWNSWGQHAPDFADCPAPCPGINWSMGAASPSMSMSGHATQFNLGGTRPYSDVLWSKPVLGQFSTQELPDYDHKLLPTLHNFTYDAYFYASKPQITQVLEFDVSMYLNGTGMIWGTQCRIAGGNEWDIWDNVNAKWVPTGIACNPISNGWNHVTVQVQRKPDNTLLFQSITLNGVTAVLNKTYAPFTVPDSWWGVTVNYQMDGDEKQSANTTYLDNFSLTYW